MSDRRWIRLEGGPSEYDGRMLGVDVPPIRLVAQGLDDDDFLDPEAHTWVYAHTAHDGTPVYKYREI